MLHSVIVTWCCHVTVRGLYTVQGGPAVYRPQGQWLQLVACASSWQKSVNNHCNYTELQVQEKVAEIVTTAKQAYIFDADKFKKFFTQYNYMQCDGNIFGPGF